MLATGHLVVSADPRISVEKHSGVNSLVLKHIKEHEAVDNVCQSSNLFNIGESAFCIYKFILILDLDIECATYIICARYVQHTLYVQGMYHCILS